MTTELEQMKEWWIRPADEPSHQNSYGASVLKQPPHVKGGRWADAFIHVVEYEAYAKLKAELEQARAEIERLSDKAKVRFTAQADLAKERDELKLLADNLKAKCEKLESYLNQDQTIKIERLLGCAEASVSYIEQVEKYLKQKWRGDGCQFGEEHLGCVFSVLGYARKALEEK